MKRIQRVSALLLSLLALVGALALPAGAQSAPDLTKPVSLTVHHVYNPSGENIPLAGVEFSLYLVAKMGQGGALLFEDCQKTMLLRKAEESGTIFRFF